MGMFDTVIYPETKCRTCGKPVTEYQSKSGFCHLLEVTPEQLREDALRDGADEVIFYGYCNRDWNSPNQDYPHGNHFRVTADKVEEAPEYDR